MKRSSHRHGFTLVELLLVIGMALFIIAMFFPWLTRARETACRAKCPNNLRQIGLALTMYMDANRGEYPSTGFDYTAPTTMLKLDETGRQFADGSLSVGGIPQAGWNNVPASWFLLAKTQGLSMEVFTCPSASESKDMLLALKQAYCDPDVLTELRDRTSDNAPLRRQMPSRAVGQVVIGNVFLFGVKGGGGSGHPDPDIKW